MLRHSSTWEILSLEMLVESRDKVVKGIVGDIVAA
jgi:hypothetical protein